MLIKTSDVKSAEPVKGSIHGNHACSRNFLGISCSCFLIFFPAENALKSYFILFFKVVFNFEKIAMSVCSSLSHQVFSVP